VLCHRSKQPWNMGINMAHQMVHDRSRSGTRSSVHRKRRSDIELERCHQIGDPRSCCHFPDLLASTASTEPALVARICVKSLSRLDATWNAAKSQITSVFRGNEQRHFRLFHTLALSLLKAVYQPTLFWRTHQTSL